ncbi:MAG: Crp/Fnr family transcriptional regulator [Magnetospirillum sp.]|nr:Crp/Fnr family transcriptional regulator [Magnetospirillum sp.]
MTAVSAKPPHPFHAHRSLSVTSRDLACLEGIPLFRGAFRSSPEKVEAGVSVVICAEGTTLYRQGESASRLYVVAYGGVAINASVLPGQETLLHLCQGGGFCGEEALIHGRRLSTARTVDLSRLIAIDPSVLDLPPSDVSEHFYRRLSDLTEEIVVFKSVPPFQRLARLLLDHVGPRSGSANGELPLLKKTVAAKIGVDPASLSRLLRRMKDLGVSVQGNSIKVADVGVLRGVAEQVSPVREFRRPECGVAG